MAAQSLIAVVVYILCGQHGYHSRYHGDKKLTDVEFLVEISVLRSSVCPNKHVRKSILYVCYCSFSCDSVDIAHNSLCTVFVKIFKNPVFYVIILWTNIYLEVPSKAQNASARRSSPWKLAKISLKTLLIVMYITCLFW